MLRSLWINHQKFLLISASVAVVFLALNSFISGLAEGADQTYRRCRSLGQNISRLHGELERTYWLERRRAEAYARAEAELREELALPLPPLPEGERSLLIAFNKRIDRVWGEAQSRANPRGLALPEKLSPDDFDIDPNYGPGEYRILHAYLSVVERALLIAVDSGMTSIGKPSLIPWIQSPVIADGLEVGKTNYLGAAIVLRGRFENFLRLFDLAQAEKSFLQVRIVGKLTPRSDDEEILEAEVELFGLQVDAPAAGDGAGGVGAADPPSGSRMRRRR